MIKDIKCYQLLNKEIERLGVILMSVLVVIALSAVVQNSKATNRGAKNRLQPAVIVLLLRKLLSYCVVVATILIFLQQKVRNVKVIVMLIMIVLQD